MFNASTDSGLTKMYPITVRIFDINYSHGMTKFFDMNLIEGANTCNAVAMFSSAE